MSMIRAPLVYKHTHYGLGFKVSKELLEDDLYQSTTGKFIPGLKALFKRRRKKLAGWPPKPDNLNVRWWNNNA